MLKYLVKMKTVVVWLVMLVFTILGMQAQSYYYDELKEGSTLFDVGHGKILIYLLMKVLYMSVNQIHIILN